MFDQPLEVDLASLIDIAVTLESEAKMLNASADVLYQQRQNLLGSTSGQASEAALADMLRIIDLTQVRAGKLTRNAKVMRELVRLYNDAGLAGARAFGA